MADYREISQQYAQGGIKACIVLNGGAAIALLSQAAELVTAKLSDEVMWAMAIWSLGTFLGAATWVLAFLSTRYVDKSERESHLSARHIKSSDWYMLSGLLAVGLSLVCFLVGGVVLANGLGQAAP